MRMVPFVLALVVAPSLFGTDAASFLAEGRRHIERKDYGSAVKVLQEALPGARALEDSERPQALAALHFYTAQAFSGLNNDAHARLELQQFFTLSPQTRAIDATKFDAAFVTRFKEARAAFDANARSNFHLFYPGYGETEIPADVSLAGFSNGPEMMLLASAGERQEWNQTGDEESRRRYIEAFWQKRGAAFRHEFQRRIAFADHAFSAEGVRGSLTDRGRVFIILGPPRSIRQSHLTRADAGRGLGKLAIGTPVMRGEVEQWYYGRDQFPKTIADDQLVFKFVSEAEYGEGVLERDPILMRALHEAGHTVR